MQSTNSQRLLRFHLRNRNFRTQFEKRKEVRYEASEIPNLLSKINSRKIRHMVLYLKCKYSNLIGWKKTVRQTKQVKKKPCKRRPARLTKCGNEADNGYQQLAKPSSINSCPQNTTE